MNEISPGMAFSPDELLNLAIMTKIPILIVEGIDDVPIYERLSISVNIDCDVYASGNIACNTEGCNGVLDSIKEIRSFSQNIPVENFIIGIIDLDVRPYRNELPTDPAIFPLHYYSIESHYINASSVEFLVPRFTNATNRLIKSETIYSMFDSICTKLSFLYYVSLEALKNSCVQDYQGSIGYSKPIKAIVNQGLHLSVLEKRDQLDAFASSLGLSCSLETILKICKGKWIGEIFSDALYQSISELPENCLKSKIPQCQCCENNEPNKCMYRKSGFYSSDLLMKHAYQNTEIQALSYIKNKIINLGHSIKG